MNQKSRKRYTPEFKAQAVGLLTTGKPVPQMEQWIGKSERLAPFAMTQISRL